MTTVDEMEPCPDCIPGHDSIQCQTCFGECRVSRAAASSHPSEAVERVARAIYEAKYETAKEFELGRGVAWEELAEHRREVYRQDARAALSAIPQPAEVVGPAWRDEVRAIMSAWLEWSHEVQELAPDGLHERTKAFLTKVGA
jgi:hypothetical protein